MTGSAPNNQEMALTLADAMKTLATSRHRLLWDANPPVGDPCWGLWHGFDFVGPFDSWPEAASFALGVPVVERDPTAELVQENTELRRILSECASAAGGAAAPTCSLEFFAALPREIELVRHKDTAELVEALEACADELRHAINHGIALGESLAQADAVLSSYQERRP